MGTLKDIAKDYADAKVQLAHANALLKSIHNHMGEPRQHKFLKEKIQEYLKTGKTI